MRHLSGNTEVYLANDGGLTDANLRDKLLSSCMAPQKIELKINAQVMLIKNMDDTLVNGSLGRVVGFMNQRTFALYESDPSMERYIDKTTGQFIPNVSESEEEEEEGPLMSKRRNRIKEELAMQASSMGRRFPLVQFAIPDG